MSGSHRGVPERIEETNNWGRCQEVQPDGVEPTAFRGVFGYCSGRGSA